MEQPPPYSQDSQYPPQGYVPPPNTGYQQPPPGNQGYPPQSAPYHPHQQQAGYQPHKNYGGTGYTPQGLQGYPPQGQEYPPQGQEYPPQGQGYPPQGHIQQPPGYSSHTNNTSTVVVQGQPQVVAGVIPVVKEHLCLAILACFCCVPIGIVAILKSSEAKNRYVAGDYAGAVASGQSARKWAYAAIICGSIFITLYIVLVVVAATAQ